MRFASRRALRIKDALERFEEDEMVGIVRFGKEIAYVRHFANVRYMHTVKCITVQSPGEPGFVLGVYTRTSVFLKPPFLFVPDW